MERLTASMRALSTGGRNVSREEEEEGRDATHDKLLAQIPSHSAAQIQYALNWIAFSVRPLHADELGDILRDAAKSNETPTPSSPMPAHAALLSSSGLIAIAPGSEEVTFVDESMEEYLTSDRIRASPSCLFGMNPASAHAMIAKACLEYLLRFNGPERLTSQSKATYPLVKYAARYWHVHAKALLTQAPNHPQWVQHVRPLTMQLLDPKRGYSFQNWLRISRPDVSSATKAGEQDLSEFFYGSNPDDFGSPIYYAAACGLADVVEILIAKGHSARTKAESVPGAMYPGPIEVAVEKGYADVVSLLLKAGARPNTWIQSAGTCLHRAAENGDVEVVRLLLSHNAQISSRRIDGATALHCAARSGSTAVVKMLVEHGAELDAVTEIGATPLHEAVAQRHEAVVRMLLEYGSDIEAKVQQSMLSEQGGFVDLIAAVREQDSEACREIQDATQRTSLYMTADYNNTDLAQLLLDRGAQVDAETDLGATALHVATFRGNTAMVKLLLERGADATRRTKSGATLLHLAAQSKEPAMIDLVVDLGIDTEALDNWQDTAVFRAVYKGHLPVLQRLIERGADPAKPKALTGVQPLQIAVIKGHTEMVRYLLDQSVDPDAANLQGGTALHQAANHGRVEILRMLLEQGANINASMEQAGNRSVVHMAVMGEEKEALKELLAWKTPPPDLLARDDDGDTPLHYTVLQKNLEMTEILLSHGADPNALGLRDCSPLELAVRKYDEPNNREMIDLLVRYGGDGAAKRPDGFFMLVYAAFKNDSLLMEQLMRNQDSVEPLIDAVERAGIEARDEDWTSIGHKMPFAMLHGLEVVVWMIMEYSKVDANEPMLPQKFNMLVIAAHAGHHGIVKLLLRRGADVNGCLNPENGFKAVHAAAERGDLDMIKTLIEYGCDIHDVGDGRGTPLAWALRGRHDDVVRLLCQHGADLGAEEKRLGMVVMIGPKQIVYVTPGGQEDGEESSTGGEH